MKKYSLKLILAFLICCLAQSTKAQMNVTWADTLNKLLVKVQGDENMQGLAAGVVFSDGSTWSSAAGYHGTVPLSKDFLYDIGSNTKSMVASIILLLEEESKLSINDTLYQHIAPVPNVPFGITIKQLLGHRSGVFNYTTHPNFINEINTNDTKFWHPDSILSTFLSSPDFAPGTNYNYSNTGYILLGKVIEAIENKPLNQVLKTRIFTPMSLDSTYLDQYDPYTLTKTGAWLSPTLYFPNNFISFMSSAWAAGAVVSTPKDFAEYAHNLFSGQLLSAASLQKMQLGTNLVGSSTYGLGIIKWGYRGKTYLGHGGTTLQNSEMEYSVTSGFSLVLMNLDNGFFNETARAKLKLIDLLEYIEDVQANGMGLANNLKAEIEVSAYPNPSADYITFDLKTENEVNNITLEILDIAGRKVMETSTANSTLTLRKETAGTGIFFARILADNQWVKTERIVFN